MSASGGSSRDADAGRARPLLPVLVMARVVPPAGDDGPVDGRRTDPARGARRRWPSPRSPGRAGSSTRARDSACSTRPETHDRRVGVVLGRAARPRDRPLPAADQHARGRRADAGAHPGRRVRGPAAWNVPARQGCAAHLRRDRRGVRRYRHAAATLSCSVRSARFQDRPS